VTAEFPRVDGVQHRFVDLPGVRMRVAEAGRGDAVLLLHGWPANWYCWRRVVPALSGQFRLLMPDLRGFGWTATPGRGYDAPTFAADAVALLDELGIERAHVIGHDWGGFTAFLLALDHPERVSRMVVCNAPHPWLPFWRTLPQLWRTWYAVLNALPVLGPRAAASRRYIHWLLGHDGGGGWSGEEMDVYAERLEDPARARATRAVYRYYLRAAGQILLARRWQSSRLTAPTRILLGADDPHFPVGAMLGAPRHGDDLEVEIVRGCGHYLPEQRPDLLAERASALFRPGAS
jgi:pimeloyl-ACP methyl ester carboxylesterase